VFGRLAGAQLRSQYQYRVSFFVFLATTILITALDFVAIYFIFGWTDALGGWTLVQVLFLYGTSGVAFATADLLVGGVEYSARRIKDGSFDLLLIRPVSPLVHLLGDEFAFRRVGKIIQAAAILVVALAAVDITWTIGKVLMVPVMLVSGTVIAGSVWVITSSLAFWTVDTQEVANSFTYGGNYLTGYPLGIFADWLRVFLAFIVPLAFVNYLPALYVLGIDDTLGLPATARFFSPFVAAAAAMLARIVWTAAVRRYQSTGS
jgi:ABC-2 type transport system permease protein